MRKPPIQSVLFILAAAALLLIFYLNSCAAWADKSATYDEPLHLVASGGITLRWGPSKIGLRCQLRAWFGIRC
jgi:hypothetical protein